MSKERIIVRQEEAGTGEKKLGEKKDNIRLLLLTLMPSLMSCWAATSRAVSPSLMKPRFMQSLMLVSYRDDVHVCSKKNAQS